MKHTTVAMAYTVVFLINFKYSRGKNLVCLGVQIVIVTFESCHTQLYFIQTIRSLSLSLSISLWWQWVTLHPRYTNSNFSNLKLFYLKTTCVLWGPKRNIIHICCQESKIWIKFTKIEIFYWICIYIHINKHKESLLDKKLNFKY